MSLKKGSNTVKLQTVDCLGLARRIQNWIVDWSSACNFTVKSHCIVFPQFIHLNFCTKKTTRYEKEFKLTVSYIYLADRAKQIKTKATVNEDPTEELKPWKQRVVVALLDWLIRLYTDLNSLHNLLWRRKFCLLKTKWLMKICIFRGALHCQITRFIFRTSFQQLICFRRQPAELFSFKKKLLNES